MSLPFQSWLIYDGVMLTGPVRPRTTGDQARIRAAVRTRRQIRARGV
jgi:hypothetical protein